MTDREFLTDILPTLPYVGYEMSRPGEWLGCHVELPGSIRLYASFDSKIGGRLMFDDRPCPAWGSGSGATPSRTTFLKRTVSYILPADGGKTVIIFELRRLDVDQQLACGIRLIEAWLDSRSMDTWDLRHIDVERTSIGRVAELYGHSK